MGITRCLVRTCFAMWLCLGTQAHVALEHGAYWHHAAEHAAEAHDHHDHDFPDDHAAESDGARILALGHHHHSHEFPHEHELDAVTVASKARIHLPAVAVLPVAPLQEIDQTTLNPVDADWDPPPTFYLSQHTAPRAPPLA